MGSKKAPGPSKEQKDLAAAQARNLDEQMAFSKQQYADMMVEAKKQNARGDEEFTWQRGLADEARARSNKYDSLYDRTTGKQVQAFSDAADAYDTSAQRDKLSGMAMSDVENGLSTARGSLQRGLAARGVNMGSAAYLSAMGDMETEGGLAKASAATMAQEAARREGLQMRAQAAGLGSGYGGMAGSSLGQSSNFGMSGLSAGGTGLSAMAGAGSLYNQGSNVAQGWGQGANSTYNSIADQNYKRSQSGGMGGLGSIVGGIAGSFMGPIGTSLGASIGGAMFGGAPKKT
jgi:hypothetical protein